MGLLTALHPFSSFLCSFQDLGVLWGVKGKVANSEFIPQLMGFGESWDNQVLKKEVMPTESMSTEYLP